MLTELRCAFLEEMGQTLPDGFADRLREWIEAAFADGRLLAWFAELDGRVVGVAAVNPCPHLPSAVYRNGVGWYLLNVYVRKDYRHAGAGRALLAAIGASAREQEVDVLNLHATAQAFGWYERHGFVAASDGMRMVLDV